ncbi:MAG: tRNA lysidine(34) synthetase TilS [Flavobacteriales bacterium]|nr:tRNA lysidine(34) synthetase TilS [Flavobacteriales bacterium]
MQEQLEQILFNDLGLKKSDKILVAVSGGADSVVLLRLMKTIGIDVSVAHCNFGLRGEESDGDEKFVIELCKKLDVPYFIQSFDTQLESKRTKKTIQETARNLRYNWFFELLREHNFLYLAVAHNKTDNLETVFINQIRGSGIHGFKGIGHDFNRKIIRPLLSFTSSEIRTFAAKNNWEYRNDSSNDSDKYLRNKLRQELLPVLTKIEPNIEEIVFKNSQKVTEHIELYNFLLSEKIRPLLIEEGEQFKIPKVEIKRFPQSHLVLYDLLNTFGFSIAQCIEITQNITVGSVYHSHTHKLNIDRECYFIKPLKSSEESIQIDTLGIYTWKNVQIEFSKIPESEVDFSDCCSCFFDMNKTILPILVRAWKKGDKIQPFGMKGKKLVSDILVDNKIALFDKKNIPVFCDSDNEIIWIGGLNTSEKLRFSARGRTEKTFGRFRIDLKK